MKDNLRCPHCGSSLQAVRMPTDAGFDTPYHLVCFENTCQYYREGWEWMRQQYRQNVSYRYRVDPSTGVATPLPVWSEDALVDLIVKPGKPAAPRTKRAGVRRPAKSRRRRVTSKKSKPTRRSR